jgi:hypothetical protein
MRYKILALDPGPEAGPAATILAGEWATEQLPRIGEQVRLPADEQAATSAPVPRAGLWQELSVVEVVHGPAEVEVALGGTTGWEPGSVAPLFEYARRFMGQVSDG